MPDTSVPVITPRGLEINRDAARPFEAVKVARDMLHATRVAALATLDTGSGYPYNTTTNLATMPDGAPLFFAAGLSLHARNMESDPRISLTLADFANGDVLTSPRLTFSGLATRLAGEAFEQARQRYLSRYPKAKLYLSLPDTILYRMEIEGVQINGGPTRNANDVIPEDLLIDIAAASELLQAEQDEITRINNTPELLATVTLKAGSGENQWRVTGIDPAGLDLSSRGVLKRLWFTRPVNNHDELLQELAAPVA